MDFSAISNVIEKVVKASKGAISAEEYRQIQDWWETSRSLRAEVDKITIESSRLTKENNDLKEKLHFQENSSFENGAYWTNIDGRKNGPYCTTCWDTEKISVRLTDVGDKIHFLCQSPKHKNPMTITPFGNKRQGPGMVTAFGEDEYY